MSDARLPRLLDANFAEARRLRPIELSATMSLREPSTAEMRLGDENLAMHSWVELYAGASSLGLFRVTGFDDKPRRETSVTLRHAIDTLSDEVWAAQLDYSGTVAQYLADLLAQQTTVRWQLGTCDDTGNWEKKGINYQLLSELLWELSDDHYQYCFTFDFSTSPWTLNFVSVPSDVSAEFRLSRNAQQVQIRRSDEGMFNRLIVSVVGGSNPGIRTYNDTASQALYGIITKVATAKVEEIPDPGTWAQQLLSERSSPIVQVSIDGYELSRLTGETYDHMSIGKRCRLALPSVPETLTETIVTVEYPDLLSAPEHVTVELSNHLQKFSETIQALKKAAGGSGGGSRATGGSTLSEVDHWGMVVRKVGIEDVYETGLWIDPVTGATIYNMQEGMRSNRGEITVNAQNIGLVVQNGAINAASIVLAVNNSGSSVTISADKITLTGGQTIVDALDATDAKIDHLEAGDTIAAHLKGYIMTAGTLAVTAALSVEGTAVGWYTKTFTDGNGTPVQIKYLGYPT